MTGAVMQVQIFGVAKSAETRKALRFFSERRIQTHFVDLLERPMAETELKRFADRYGVDALVDRGSRRFEELGLHHANLNDARWFNRLCAEPLLLRMPLVRRLGNPPAVTVGAAEEVWKGWIKDSIKSV
jgi:arsenate reductase (glutaredoxin)